MANPPKPGDRGDDLEPVARRGGALNVMRTGDVSLPVPPPTAAPTAGAAPPMASQATSEALASLKRAQPGVRPRAAPAPPPPPPARRPPSDSGDTRNVGAVEGPGPAAAQTPKRRPPLAALAVVVGVLVIGVGGGVVVLGGPDVSLTDRVAVSGLWAKTAVVTGIPELTAAVTAVGESAVRGLPLEGAPPPRFLVLADEQRRAFALADGSVVVSIGLLRQITSEAELAAAIAHVRAHVTLGHIKRGFADRPVDASLAAVEEELLYDAEEEAAADAAAVHALKIGGWEPAALRILLESLQGHDDAWLTRHPNGAERVAALKVEELKRLPETKRVVSDAGRMNTAEYTVRVLPRLPPLEGAPQKKAKGPATTLPATTLPPTTPPPTTLPTTTLPTTALPPTTSPTTSPTTTLPTTTLPTPATEAKAPAPSPPG